MITMLVIAYIQYALLRKLGHKGWEFYVPLYSEWKYAEIVTGSGLNLLKLFIPALAIPFLYILAILYHAYRILAVAALSPVIVGTIIGIVLLLWNIRFAKILAEAYNAKAVWMFFIQIPYLAYYVFKDAPNCDDPVNAFVTRIFKLGPEKREAPSAPAFVPADPFEEERKRADAERDTKLAKLKTLLDQGVITEKEYQDLVKEL